MNVAQNHPGALPLSLANSDDRAGFTVWQRLRTCGGWRRPHGAVDDQAPLTVQVMETWFLADREAPRKYPGRHFRENALGA